LIWYAIKHPVPRDVLFSKVAAKGGFTIGTVSSLMVASNFAAISYVDNPGIIPAIKFLDTFLIMAYYRATGRKEEADVVAGIGIVMCAALIIIVKTL
jgi:hypothetical protein